MGCSGLLGSGQGEGEFSYYMSKVCDWAEPRGEGEFHDIRWHNIWPEPILLYQQQRTVRLSKTRIQAGR